LLPCKRGSFVAIDRSGSMAAHKKSRMKEDNSVEFQGYEYATHNFAPPNCTVECKKTETFTKLPAGWELAPDEPAIAQEVIGRHPWSIQVLQVRGGQGYHTAIQNGHFSGDRYAIVTNISWSGDSCKPQGGSCGLLIRRKCVNAQLEFDAKQHQSNLLANMHEQMLFADCTVVCSDQILRCHRAVLAGISPVFQSMLTTEMLEGQEQRIQIQDVEPAVLQALIAFAYTGVLPPSVKDLTALLTLADRYQISNLVVACCGPILEHVSCADVALVIHALNPLAANPAVRVMLDDIAEKLQADQSLLHAVMEKL